MLQFFIYYLVVPAIYLVILAFDVLLITRAKTVRQRFRSIAGAIGGMLISVILILLDDTTDIFNRSSMPDASSFEEVWPYIILAFIIGIVIPFVVDIFLRYRITSFIVLFTVMAIFISAYFLLTVSQIRNIVSVATIGFLVGGIMYLMVRPDTFQDFLSGGASSRSSDSRWSSSS